MLQASSEQGLSDGVQVVRPQASESSPQATSGTSDRSKRKACQYRQTQFDILTSFRKYGQFRSIVIWKEKLHSLNYSYLITQAGQSGNIQVAIA